MKIAFCADVHLGNHKAFGVPDAKLGYNSRARLIIQTFMRALGAARKHGCRAFVVCGDFFDKCNPGPALTAAALSTIHVAKQMTLVFINGNHDHVSSSTSALDPIDATSLGFVVKTHGVPTNLSLYALPYQTDSITRALQSIKPTSDCSILAIHAGISDEHDDPWMRAAHDAVAAAALPFLLEDTSIRTVVAGNWHTPKQWDVGGLCVIQCGALAPTGFADESDGSIVIYDTDNHTWFREIIAGPRFKTFDFTKNEVIRDVTKWAELIQSAGSTPFARVLVNPEDESACRVDLLQTFASLHDMYTSDMAAMVKIDKKLHEQNKQHMRKALTISRSREESIVRYVDAMKLPASVSKKSLLEKLSEYLK